MQEERHRVRCAGGLGEVDLAVVGAAVLRPQQQHGVVGGVALRELRAHLPAAGFPVVAVRHAAGVALRVAADRQQPVAQRVGVRGAAALVVVAGPVVLAPAVADGRAVNSSRPTSFQPVGRGRLRAVVRPPPRGLERWRLGGRRRGGAARCRGRRFSGTVNVWSGAGRASSTGSPVGDGSVVGSADDAPTSAASSSGPAGVSPGRRVTATVVATSTVATPATTGASRRLRDRRVSGSSSRRCRPVISTGRPRSAEIRSISSLTSSRSSRSSEVRCMAAEP